VGPQSIPRSVRETLRQGLGLRVGRIYGKLVDEFLLGQKKELSESNNVENDSSSSSNFFPSQVAIQLIFDLKYCGWFHPKLNERVEGILRKLEGFIDPFDLDIAIPKLKTNLKRFLFETHVISGFCRDLKCVWNLLTF
jgi:hypothetical protein